MLGLIEAQVGAQLLFIIKAIVAECLTPVHSGSTQKLHQLPVAACQPTTEV